MWHSISCEFILCWIYLLYTTNINKMHNIYTKGDFMFNMNLQNSWYIQIFVFISLCPTYHFMSNMNLQISIECIWIFTVILCPTWIYEMHAIFKITHFSLYVHLTIHWIYPNLDFISIMNLQDTCKIFFVCPTYMRKLMSETRILNWNSGKLCQKLTVTTASWWGLWPMSETRRRLSHYRLC